MPNISDDDLPNSYFIDLPNGQSVAFLSSVSIPEARVILSKKYPEFSIYNAPKNMDEEKAIDGIIVVSISFAICLLISLIFYNKLKIKRSLTQHSKALWISGWIAIFTLLTSFIGTFNSIQKLIYYPSLWDLNILSQILIPPIFLFIISYAIINIVFKFKKAEDLSEKVIELTQESSININFKGGEDSSNLSKDSINVEDGDNALLRKEYDTALIKYKRAAEKNNSYAQVQLGNMYDEGLGVVQDYAEAVRWYKLAAAQGYATAQNDLGIMYNNGQGVAEDYAEAVRWYKLAAVQGHALAQFNLGTRYKNGEGVVQDYAEAVRWYKLAAAQGEAGAQLNLGNAYDEGKGVVQDYTEAVRCYKLAAAQGDAMAQFNLGLKYDNGIGVVRDYAEAVRWYKLAAAQGDAEAQINLGYMYGNGLGVVVDYTRAHMWYNLAAVKGESVAVKSRDIVPNSMTQQQIAEAQKLARECQERNFKNCD